MTTITDEKITGQNDERKNIGTEKNNRIIETLLNVR